MADLQIGGSGSTEWAPGNMPVSIGNGTPGSTLIVSIDGAPTGQQIQVGTNGAVPSVSIVLPSLVTGSHSLDIATSDASDSGSLAFTVARNPATAPAASTPPTPSAPAVAGRWQFEDPVTREIYTFTLNPSTASSPFAGRPLTDQVTTTGHPLTSEGNPRSSTWTLTGHLNDQTQYDVFLAWAMRPYRIFVTDDLGRQYVGMILTLDAVPVTPSRVSGFPNRSTYTMTIELGLA